MLIIFVVVMNFVVVVIVDKILRLVFVLLNRIIIGIDSVMVLIVRINSCVCLVSIFSNIDLIMLFMLVDIRICVVKVGVNFMLVIIFGIYFMMK